MIGTSKYHQCPRSGNSFAGGTAMDHNLDIAVAIATMIRPAIIAVLLMGLWAGVHRTELPPRARIATWIGAAVPLISWFAIADWLGRSGVSEPRPHGPPLLPIAIALPVTDGLVPALRSSRLGARTDAVPAACPVGGP